MSHITSQLFKPKCSIDIIKHISAGRRRNEATKKSKKYNHLTPELKLQINTCIQQVGTNDELDKYQWVSSFSDKHHELCNSQTTPALYKETVANASCEELGDDSYHCEKPDTKHITSASMKL